MNNGGNIDVLPHRLKRTSELRSLFDMFYIGSTVRFDTFYIGCVLVEKRVAILTNKNWEKSAGVIRNCILRDNWGKGVSITKATLGGQCYLCPPNLALLHHTPEFQT